MILGTALFRDGLAERRVLVARLSDGRLADLNRIEFLRLEKLGEGHPELLAEALVPPSLRRLLEGGPRALQRARQTLAYAEKWRQRGDLPELIAPTLASVSQLPCLPRPALLRRADGTHRDRLAVKGPGVKISSQPQIMLAVLGGYGEAQGYCLAAEDGDTTLLGGWMSLEIPKGNLELRAGNLRRSVALEAWEHLELPPLRPGEVMLLPPPRLKPLPALEPGAHLRLTWPIEEMELILGEKLPHPTLQ